MFAIIYAAMLLIVLFQLLVAIGLIRKVQRLQVVLEQRGLPRPSIGSISPAFDIIDIGTGAAVPSALALRNQLTLLLFLTGSCPKCRALLDALRATRLPEDIQNLLLICAGDVETCEPLLRNVPSRYHRYCSGESLILGHFRIASFPSAVIVDSEQIVRGYGNPLSVRELEEFIIHTLQKSDGARMATT